MTSRSTLPRRGLLEGARLQMSGVGQSVTPAFHGRVSVERDRFLTFSVGQSVTLLTRQVAVVRGRAGG